MLLVYHYLVFSLFVFDVVFRWHVCVVVFVRCVLYVASCMLFVMLVFVACCLLVCVVVGLSLSVFFCLLSFLFCSWCVVGCRCFCVL